MDKTAKIIIDGKEFAFPTMVGTMGDRAIDITRLRDQTGYIAYDPGFNSVGSCASAITFVDGDKGILKYRGIPIEQFKKCSDFIDCVFLLIFGHLPSAAEYARFNGRVEENSLLHEGMRHIFEGFPTKAPPMAMLSAMVNVLSCYHDELLSNDSEEAFEEAAARLISKVRTVAAFSYRKSRGLPLIYPDNSLRYCANYFHMLFSMPYRQHRMSAEMEEALNLILILHADHEQNCSTSTVRMVGSSKANLFASVAAGISALWGPLHGGANVEVIEMLESIHRGGVTAEKCIEMAKDRNSGFKLFGFGHRVYKNFDPRAILLREVGERMFQRLNISDPLLDIARRLEELALKDQYFIDRKLYPNVDFYSGIIMRAMSIPTNMFTVMFAMGRLPGWIAQWKEQRDTPNVKLARPRQVYTGAPDGDWRPVGERVAGA